MADESTHPAHSPDEERRIRDAALDKTLEATFPASDPPSSLPNPDEDDAIEDAGETNRHSPQPPRPTK